MNPAENPSPGSDVSMTDPSFWLQHEKGVKKNLDSPKTLHTKHPFLPIIVTNMKLSQIIIASAITSSHGFVVLKPTQTSTSLKMGGFLDGKAPKIMIREQEDAAMWIDEPPKKATPAAKKGPVAKKGKEAPKKEAPKKSGFKFPWDK